MELEPGVIGLLSTIGGIMIMVVLILTFCVMCLKCCKDRQSPKLFSTNKHLQSEHVSRTDSMKSQDLKSKTCLRQTGKHEADYIISLKDSVIVRGDVLPMSTEYPRVYGGQYFIGMTGGNEVHPQSSWNVDHLCQEQPHNYHLIVP